MKKWFTLNNIFTLLLFVFLIYTQAPSVLNNFRMNGIKLIAKKYEVIFPKEKSDPIFFPPQNSRVITIFWATWCGPCKAEMGRLKASVESGKISKNSIFAINPFEDRSSINNFLLKNNFPFIFIDAPEIALQLNISATPTTLFVENGAITSMSSGMSLIGIWRAEMFL